MRLATIFAAIGAALALTACAGPALVNAGVVGGEVVSMWATKPSAGEPADPDLQMQPHENWCYATMGEPQCFTCAQDVPPDRLINVDPANRYPLTLRAYNEELVSAR